MALKPCRECGNEVSTEAATCPHCGVAGPAGPVNPNAEQPGVSKWVKVLGAVAVVAVLMMMFGGEEDEPELADSTTGIRSSAAVARPAPPPANPDHEAINAWLTGWSERQAASARETCSNEAGCDPSRYEPAARPETTFGWGGASGFERIEDWAQGPRYWVTANGQRALVYLQDRDIASVHLGLPDGGRRTLCRNVECR